MNQIIGREPRPSEDTAPAQADSPSSSTAQALAAGKGARAKESRAGEICLSPAAKRSEARLTPPPRSDRAPLRSIALAQQRNSGQSPRPSVEQGEAKTRLSREHRPYRPTPSPDPNSGTRQASLASPGRAKKEALAQRYCSEPGRQKGPVPILTLSPYRPPAANIGQYLGADLGYWERLVGWCRRLAQGFDKPES